MTRNNGFRLGFSCFTLGAAIGACMAALYTPQSGRRTRRLLLRKAEDVQEIAADARREIADKGRQLYERSARFTEHAIGR